MSSGGFMLGRIRVNYVAGPLPEPCWIWRGCVNSRGYGVRGVNGKRMLVHRASYEEHVRPLAPGEIVHHRCEQKRCINPTHLQATTSLAHNRHHLGRPSATAFLEEIPAGWPFALSELAGDDFSYDALKIALRRASADGWARRVGRGMYEILAREPA